MTQFNFNVDMDVIKEELIGSNLNATIKSSIILILNQMMEQERDEYLKSSSYERTGDRVDYRNGYYERDYMLSIGKITLKVPRSRNGKFSPSLFERYQRTDQALIATMVEMVVQGVSTRKVTQAVVKLCGENVSKSFVSSLTERLDPFVKEWSSRSLVGKEYPYIYTDALYIKVREYQKVVSKAVYIAVGVNEDHKREIIGFHITHDETKAGWESFFESLQSRGLLSPKLVISDAHKGLKAAIHEAFTGSSWQRCTVHFKRNIFSALPKKETETFRSLVKDIFTRQTQKEARALYQEIASNYEGQKKYENALNKLEEGLEDAIQYMSEQKSYHPLLRSTNNLERLNSEVRRREGVIRIFPNQQSAFRLIGAVLKDYDELKLCKRKYLPET